MLFSCTVLLVHRAGRRSGERSRSPVSTALLYLQDSTVTVYRVEREGLLSLFCSSSSSSTPCRAKMASPQGNRHHAQRTSAVGGPEVRLFKNSAGENLNIFVLLYFLHHVCVLCSTGGCPPHKNISAASLGREHAPWLGELAHGTALQQYDELVSGHRSNHFPPCKIANVPNQTVLGRFRCMRSNWIFHSRGLFSLFVRIVCFSSDYSALPFPSVHIHYFLHITLQWSLDLR